MLVYSRMIVFRAVAVTKGLFRNVCFKVFRVPFLAYIRSAADAG